MRSIKSAPLWRRLFWAMAYTKKGHADAGVRCLDRSIRHWIKEKEFSSQTRTTTTTSLCASACDCWTHVLQYIRNAVPISVSFAYSIAYIEVTISN